MATKQKVPNLPAHKAFPALKQKALNAISKAKEGAQRIATARNQVAQGKPITSAKPKGFLSNLFTVGGKSAVRRVTPPIPVQRTSLRGFEILGLSYEIMGAYEILGDALTDSLNSINDQINSLQQALQDMTAQDTNIQSQIVQLENSPANAGGQMLPQQMPDGSIAYGYAAMVIPVLFNSDAQLNAAMQQGSAEIDSLNNTVANIDAQLQSIQAQQQQFAQNVSDIQSLQQQLAPISPLAPPQTVPQYIPSPQLPPMDYQYPSPDYSYAAPVDYGYAPTDGVSDYSDDGSAGAIPDDASDSY